MTLKMKQIFIFVFIMILSFRGSIFSPVNRILTATTVYNQAAAPYPPRMAVNLSSGNFVITLQTGSFQIFMNWFNNAGVSTKTLTLCTNGCFYPSVAASSQGGILLVYFNSLAGQITAIRYDDNQLAQKTLMWSGTPTSTTATSISNGSYAFCWNSSGTLSVIIADSTLTTVKSPISVTGDSATIPSLGGLSNGNFCLTWNVMTQIYATIFDPVGNSAVSTFVINTSSVGNRFSPSVAGLSNGSFVIVWNAEQTGTKSVYAKIIGNNGVAITSNEFLVNSKPYDGYHYPTVAENFSLTQNIGFVVVWQTIMQSGSDIYFKEFDYLGNASSAENLGNTITTGDQTFPFVMSHPSQRYYIAYISTGTSVMLDKASDVRTNPTCININENARSWSNTTIISNTLDFTLSMYSPLMSDALLQIKILSLPAYGSLINSSTGTPIAINSSNNYNKINYIPALVLEVYFYYQVIDNMGQMSDQCLFTINSCYGNCASCFIYGNWVFHYCTDCQFGYAKTNLLAANNCDDISYTNTCCTKGCLGLCCTTYATLVPNCMVATCPGTCTVCKLGYYLDLSGNCNTSCPSGQYAPYNVYTCLNCPVTNCMTCNSSVCIVCKSGYNYNAANNTCVAICPTNYYANTATQQCLRCSLFCSTCNSLACLVCNTNYFIHIDGLCYNPCSAGYYGNTATGTCEPCSANCSTCSSSSLCLTCQSSYYLVSSTNSCSLSCPSGFYANASNGMCSACPSACSACTGLTTCSSCTSGYYLNPLTSLCAATCPSGYFINTSTSSCSTCPSYCSTCSSSTQCTTCATNYFLNNSIGSLCYSTCSAGYYGNTATGTCAPCSANCSTCSSSSLCLTCQNGFNLDSSTHACIINSSNQSNCITNCSTCLNSTTCDECGIGYFLNQNTCKLCGSNCDICISSSTCLTCSVDYFLDYHYKCLSTCYKGSYADSINRKCTDCPIEMNCATCADANSCTSCPQNYYKNDNGACLNLCDWSCNYCLDGLSCTVCLDGFFKDPSSNNLCVPNCPSGYYGSTVTGSCEACSSHCDFCASATDCFTCSSGYFRASSGQCQTCIPNCDSCNDNATCDICTEGFNMSADNSSCSISCNDGFYLNGIEGCVACDSSCGTCVESSSCLVCANGLYFDRIIDNLCHSYCSNGYFANDSTSNCDSCDFSCDNCYDAYSCASCPTGFYFDYNLDSLCHSSCLSGYFGNTVTGACEPCSSNCGSCTSNTSCLVCETNYYLYNGESCYGSCPTNYFNDNASGTGLCSLCISNCENCTNSSECDYCTSGFSLYEKDKLCYSSAPQNTFYNNNTGQYESCPLNCDLCSSKSTCESCSKNHVLNPLDLQCYSGCIDGFYMDSNTGGCKVCASNCSKCTSSTLCLGCDPNYFLDPSKTSCNFSCPLGYFRDFVTRLCPACVSNCDTCTNISTCRVCSSGFSLSEKDNLCYNSPPPNTFYNSITDQFELCSSNCDQCSDALKCTKCATGFFVNIKDSLCYSSNPPQTFFDTASNQYLSCSSNCATCSNSLTCGTCSLGSLFNTSDSLCYTSAPLKSFLNIATNRYESCPSNCDYCIDSATCSTCSTGYFLNLLNKFCNLTCPTKYFPNIANNQCETCPSNCNTCLNTNLCTSCSTNYFLDSLVDNLCHNNCSPGFFGDTSTGNCEKCSSNCTTCTNNTNCLTCSNNFYLLAADSLCYSSCPNGMFADKTTGICAGCSSTCTDCSSGGVCTLCKTGYFLHLANNQCYGTCPTGYFNNSVNNQCGLCPSNCPSCSNENTCISCAANYFLNNLVDNLCYSTCAKGYFKNTVSNTCGACSTNCSSCDDETTCTFCNSSFFLHHIDKKCYSSCPANYFNNASASPNQCLSCPLNCSNCLNGNVCLGCSSNYFLNNLVDHQCYLVCPSGYFGNTVTKKCETCPSNCNNCSNGATCSICNFGLFLYLDNQCYSTCPDGYFADPIPQTCEQCPNNCKNCYNSAECSWCNSGYNLHLLDNQCYNLCPTYFYANSITNQCDSCSSNCRNCIDENKCTICSSNYYLHHLVDNKCYSVCPDKFYANTTTNTCESCSTGCKNCKDDKICTECDFGSFIFNNYCFSNCPNSFFADAPSKSCLACTDYCQNCMNQNTCISCTPGYFLQPDQTCASVCPVGYMRSTSTGTCGGCPKNCISCSSTSDCNICSKGFYLNLQNNLCYNPCPDGYFGNDNFNTCDPCGSNCKKCDDSSQCSICMDSFYLNPEDMSCVQTCPDFYFKDNTKKACKGCPSNCVNCQNDVDCNLCQPSYFLFLPTNKCHNPCPDGFYGDSSANQCKQCNQLCNTCTGPNESDCLTCAPPKSKIGDKCIITCPGTQIYDASSFSCIPLNKLISTFQIQGPGEIDIEIVSSFNITITLERNILFKNLPLNLQLVWGNTYGGKLLNNNQTLTIYNQDLSPGIISFPVNLVILDNPITSINLDVNLRTYKLVPILKNITALQMQHPIFLDASQSYDQRDIGSTSINLEPINFHWICPGELKELCSEINTNILMLTYDNYKEYVQVNGQSFEITLELTRDVKSSSLIFPITLDKIQITVDTNFWYIAQKTKGTFNEDVIFSVVLLNSTEFNYRLGDFKYYWTIPNFDEINYLNTRRESNLRVKISDINNLIDSVECQLISIADQTEYYKSFKFQSINLPFGKCQVNPPVGISGLTPFVITASNWISNNQPLQYAFYYENYFGIKYYIKTFYTQSFISLLPYGTNFFLEVTDSQGYVSAVNCNVQIKINSEINDLDSQFLSVLDKFTENEVYFSNKNSKYVTGYTNFNFIDSLNFINNLFDTNQDTLIESNMEKIISLVNILNFCESDLQTNSNLVLLNNLLEKVSIKLSSISHDLHLITKYAKVTDDNFQRYYSNEANAQDQTILQQYNIIWNNIINSVYSSLISGQDAAIVTDYERITISKISSINMNSIKLMTTNDEGLFIIRIIPRNTQTSISGTNDTSSSNDCGYAIESDVCIERSQILSKLSLNGLSEIGIFIKVINFPFVPNQTKNSYLFSMNTIKVSLSTEGSGVISRLLAQTGPVSAEKIHYQSYLNLVDLDGQQFDHASQSTTCVNYDANYNVNATTCNSWYDKNSKVSLCDCATTGYIANLYDPTLAELSRSSQFPSLQYSYLNNYSIGVILALIIVVGSIYLLASIIDISQEYTKKHKVNKYYDLGQNMIVDYTKLGFDKKYGLLKLFFYTVKMTHPLLSIFYIYSPKYSRGLRVLDLYIQIKITFLFSLLPYYLTDNSDFTAIKNARSVADKDKAPGDLSVAITRILWSVVYSVSGIICARIIIGFLNAIHYENILENESNEKNKYMLKTIKKTYTDDVFVYSNRYKQASIKMKTLITVREAYRDLAQKNQIKATSSLKPKSSQKKKTSVLKIQKCYDPEIKRLVMFTLDHMHNSEILVNVDENHFMAPRPIYDFNEDLCFDAIYSSNRIKIVKEQSFIIPRAYKKSNNRIEEFVSTQSEYDYKIRANKHMASVSIMSLQIIDKEWLNEDYRIKKKRSELKTRLFIILFISSYVFLLIMITNVYNKYQDNIFKICITPLLSVILIRFMVTQNVMIFVHSFFMYMFGEKYYNDNRKSLNPLKLVFKYVIPGNAKANHKALLAYRKLNTMLSKNE